MLISREKLAWAAGLFEGEGCFTGGLPKHGRYRTTAALQMTDFPIVEEFARVVGVGSICTTWNGRPSDRPCRRWQASTFETTQHVVAILWPWLGERRRARAKEVLAAYHEGQKVPYKRNTCLGANKWNAKLSDQNVRDIRREYASGFQTHRELSVVYGVSHRVIGRVVRHERWAHA